MESNELGDVVQAPAGLKIVDAKAPAAEPAPEGLQTPGVSEVESEPDIATEVIKVITRNYFGDVALQSMGLMLLGTAIRRFPELNDATKYDAVTVDAITPECAGTTRIVLEPVETKLESLSCCGKCATDISDSVAMAWIRILRHHKPIVGSMRMLVTIDSNTALQFTLLCLVREGIKHE